jgi:hypothetical protein
VDKTNIAGAMLAAAIGLAFVTQPVIAAETNPPTPAQVKCIGGNSCKGHSSCQSAHNSCKGQNSCKGKGWVMSANARECEARGGHPEQSKP